MAAALWLGAMAQADAATVCKAERDQPTREHWRYRMVEGKQCWYPGRDRRDKSLLTWERVIERKFYTREDLAPPEPPAPELEIEYHPDEMVNTFEERWRLK